jgi:hypothetical protein
MVDIVNMCNIISRYNISSCILDIECRVLPERFRSITQRCPFFMQLVNQLTPGDIERIMRMLVTDGKKSGTD